MTTEGLLLAAAGVQWRQHLEGDDVVGRPGGKRDAVPLTNSAHPLVDQAAQLELGDHACSPRTVASLSTDTRRPSIDIS